MTGMTNLGEKFSASVLQPFFEQAVTPAITNSDYEGALSAGGADRMNILTFGTVNIVTYAQGTPMSLQNVTDSEAQLILSQKKAFYIGIFDIDKFETYVSDPKSSLMVQASGSLMEAVDNYVLGLYGDVASGSWDGTSYTTGTVTVTITTGAVTGNGTTFIAGMVGKPFKAQGHTKWYRVKTYNGATDIVIEDDLDDVASQYTGGTIGAGATYEIQANTSVQVTKSNFYARVLALKLFLDQNKIPKADRWLVIPAWLENIALQTTELIPAVPVAYSDTVLNGNIGKVAKFSVYTSEQIAGNSTTGSFVLAGHKSAITFAMGFKKDGVENVTGEFEEAYKALWVYGAKIPDIRRKALALGFWKA
jgi:hypothetical protein